MNKKVVEELFLKAKSLDDIKVDVTRQMPSIPRKALKVVTKLLEEAYQAGQDAIAEELKADYAEKLEEEREEIEEEAKLRVRAAHVAGYAEAIEHLELAFDGTNGYHTIGHLRDHKDRLDTWLVSERDILTPLFLYSPSGVVQRHS